MARRPNNEIRLRCNTCIEFTQSINPIIIKKETNNRLHIKAVCSICNKFKTKYLNIEQVKLLPNEVKNAPDNTTFTDNIIKEGKALPLLALIPAIIAGITALTSVAGTTASVVLENKQANETERHNKAIEQIAQGGAISNDIIKKVKVRPLV